MSRPGPTKNGSNRPNYALKRMFIRKFELDFISYIFLMTRKRKPYKKKLFKLKHAQNCVRNAIKTENLKNKRVQSYSE